MNKITNTPFVPVSWGELLDKITILEIKELKIHANTAQENIKKELQYLLDVANAESFPDELIVLKSELKNINLKLWDIEDQIRLKELTAEFDIYFIELARSVYLLNDIRAKTKQTINLILCSEIVEVKSYTNFNP
jgi:hypothetical protein